MKVSGVIDFDDTQHSLRVLNVAVAMTCAMILNLDRDFNLYILSAVASNEIAEEAQPPLPKKHIDKKSSLVMPTPPVLPEDTQRVNHLWTL